MTKDQVKEFLSETMALFPAGARFNLSPEKTVDLWHEELFYLEKMEVERARSAIVMDGEKFFPSVGQIVGKIIENEIEALEPQRQLAMRNWRMIFELSSTDDITEVIGPVAASIIEKNGGIAALSNAQAGTTERILRESWSTFANLHVRKELMERREKNNADTSDRPRKRENGMGNA